MNRHQYWHTGIYGCIKDKDQACDTCLCSCCEVSRQCNILYCDGAPTRLSWLALFTTPCLCYCFAFYLRRKTARVYNIPEPTVLGLPTVVLCIWCSICQVHREMAFRRRWPGRTLSCVYEGPMGGSPDRQCDYNIRAMD